MTDVHELVEELARGRSSISLARENIGLQKELQHWKDNSSRLAEEQRQLRDRIDEVVRTANVVLDSPSLHRWEAAKQALDKALRDAWFRPMRGRE